MNLLYLRSLLDDDGSKFKLFVVLTALGKFAVTIREDCFQLVIYVDLETCWNNQLNTYLKMIDAASEVLHKWRIIIDRIWIYIRQLADPSLVEIGTNV